VQTSFLRQFAPQSLHLLFQPKDTGNPGFDFNNHLELYANRRADATDSHGTKFRLCTGNLTRIDLESTLLLGGRVLGRVEIDLGAVDDQEQQYKILAVPYAQKQLGNIDNAVEFVRVIKQAVSAGVEADPRTLQIWASYGYNEITSRYAEVLRNNPTLAQRAKTSPSDAATLAEFKATIIQDVLTEIAVIGMELTAITTTNEDRLLDEPEEVELFSTRDQKLTRPEIEDLRELRYEMAFDHDTAGPFAAELKAICAKISPAHSSGFVNDEETQFQNYLAETFEAGGVSQENLQDIQESHERVTEQYSEGGVVSLHMSDGEKFVVDGTLEEDVNEDYLPQEAKQIASDIRHLFTEGEDMATIDEFIELALNRIYGDPTNKADRTNRTMRAVTTVASQRSPVEYTYRISVYPNREERAYVREVLDTLLESTQRDFIFRAMNRSTAFRGFHNAIAQATDVRSLITTIQDAYQARVTKNISVKMFTALDTLYKLRRAGFESTAIQVIRTVDGKERTFRPAVPVISLAKTIAVRDLRQLATKMHTLPAQERERVSRILRTERPEVYSRIVDGLLEMVAQATQGKKLYLKFAFYQDRKTGKPNEPHNMIHLLTGPDTAAIWEALKASGIQEPIAA